MHVVQHSLRRSGFQRSDDNMLLQIVVYAATFGFLVPYLDLLVTRLPTPPCATVSNDSCRRFRAEHTRSIAPLTK